jgi:hypothetical protein
MRRFGFMEEERAPQRFVTRCKPRLKRSKGQCTGPDTTLWRDCFRPNRCGLGGLRDERPDAGDAREGAKP